MEAEAGSIVELGPETADACVGVDARDPSNIPVTSCREEEDAAGEAFLTAAERLDSQTCRVVPVGPRRGGSKESSKGVVECPIGPRRGGIEELSKGVVERPIGSRRGGIEESSKGVAERELKPVETSSSSSEKTIL